MLWAVNIAAEECTGGTQQLPFDDSFETDNNCWTVYDLDDALNGTPAFQRTNRTFNWYDAQGTHQIPFARTGGFAYVASLSTSGTYMTSDVTQTLLLSPKFSLPSGSIPKLSFYSRSLKASNKISVLVFENLDAIIPNTPLDRGFISIWGPQDFTPPPITFELAEWEQITLDLRTFAGQEIYIGFYYDGDAYGNHDYWCIDDLSIYQLDNNDAGVTQIVSPQTGTGLKSNEAIKIKVSNFGQGDITDISVSLKIDGVTVATETIYGTLGSEKDTLYTFIQRADLSLVKDYVIEATVADDDNNTNNSASSTVHNYGNFTISLFPYIQTFEEEDNSRIFWKQEFVDYYLNPLEWIYMKGLPSYGVTVTDNAHNGVRNATFSAFYLDALLAIKKYITKLVSPKIELAALNAPILTFWHLQPGGQTLNNDILKVYYRTAEENDWTLLYTENRKLNSWTKTILALPNKTDNYYIAFEGISDNGNDIGIDDIIIENNDNIDVRVLDITAPKSVSTDMTEETVTVKIQNLGGTQIYGIPLKFEINGVLTANETANITLNSFEEGEYSFTTKANLSNEGVYEIKAYADYQGDVDRENDTTVKSVTNYVGKVIMGLFDEVSVCNSVFYDNGIEENYAIGNMVEQVTILPQTAGNRVKVEFLFYSLKPIIEDSGFAYEGDTLLVYEGRQADRNALLDVLIGNSLTSSVVPPVYTSGVPDGALTFVFKKVSTRFDRDLGWKANVSCVEPHLKDVGVSQIVAPLNPLNSDNAVRVSVKIKNYGSSDASNFNINLSGGNIEKDELWATITEPFTGTVSAGATEEFTFSQRVDMSNYSEKYKLSAYTSLSEDGDKNNDTITEYYIHRPNVQLKGYRFGDYDINLQYGGIYSEEYLNELYGTVAFASNTPQDILFDNRFDWRTYGAVISGCFANDKIYAFTVDRNIVENNQIASMPKYFVVLDKYFNVLSYNNINNLNYENHLFYPDDMTYDYSAKKLYGVYTGFDGIGTSTFLIEFSELNGAVLQSPQQLRYLTKCIAADSNGSLYGITHDGYFTEIDKSSGAMRVIKHTGVYEISFNYNRQSAIFDHNSGRFFWAAAGYKTGNLYEIDMNGNTTDFGTIHNGANVTALYTPFDASLGMNSVLTNDINIYPNPSKGNFIIANLPLNSSIDIFDLYGKKLESFRNSSSQITINLDLPQGIYFIKINDGNNILTSRKLIIR